MAAKIQLKNGNIGNFGGIFSTFDSFDKIGLSELIDNSLETKDIKAKYSYSDIIKNLTAIYFSGSDAIEDINVFLNETTARNRPSGGQGTSYQSFLAPVKIFKSTSFSPAELR